MLEPSERERIREAWDIYKRHTLSNSIINRMVIRDDELTLVMQENGEIPITENYGYGLYYHDCRYLSGFLMQLMDMPPTRVLSSDDERFQVDAYGHQPGTKGLHRHHHPQRNAPRHPGHGHTRLRPA